MTTDLNSVHLNREKMPTYSRWLTACHHRHVTCRCHVFLGRLNVVQLQLTTVCPK